MIHVSGRGYNSPVVKVTFHDCKMSVRVDDAHNAEIWMELRFSVTELALWFNHYVLTQAAKAADVVPPFQPDQESNP